MLEAAFLAMDRLTSAQDDRHRRFGMGNLPAPEVKLPGTAEAFAVIADARLAAPQLRGAPVEPQDASRGIARIGRHRKEVDEIRWSMQHVRMAVEREARIDRPLLEVGTLHEASSSGRLHRLFRPARADRLAWQPHLP